MQRLAAIIILTASSACSISLVGCSMCCGPDDFNYPTYGGIHQRADPASGRVGSIFSDPFVTGGPSADSNLEPYPEPRGGTSSDQFDDDLDRFEDDLDEDLKRLDRPRDLESIDPLDDEPALQSPDLDTTTATRTRWRRRR